MVSKSAAKNQKKLTKDNQSHNDTDALKAAMQKQSRLQRRVSGFMPSQMDNVEEPLKKRRNSHMEISLFGSESVDRAISAAMLLLQGSLLLGAHMFLVYVMGSWSIGSYLLIYSPIIFMTGVLIRDGYSHVIIISALISILHGCMHLNYPFLDEHLGVVREVDVWQDQCVHASQAVLFTYVWWEKLPKIGKIMAVIFLLGNASNCVVGYFCWNSWCYELYVWVSMFPAIAGGLHFAVAAMLKCPPGVGKWLCVFQGVQTVFFFIFFKSSEDVLKFFAGTRFFEIYNICPHYIGFINARLDLYWASPQDCKSPMAHVLGLERTPRNKHVQSVELSSFFPAEAVKA